MVVSNTKKLPTALSVKDNDENVTAFYLQESASNQVIDSQLFVLNVLPGVDVQDLRGTQ